MKATAQEFKVGVFIIVGLGLLVGLLLNMGVLSWDRGKTLRVLFNYAYGLELGSPVQLAGVPVGHVESIHVQKGAEGRTRVEVVCRVRPDIAVDRDAEIRISSKGLLGQKVVEITPSETSAPAAEGQLLLGSDPVVLENIAASSDRMVRKLENSVDYLNTIIGDAEFRTNLKTNAEDFTELIKTLKGVSESLGVILERMRRGEGTLGKLLTDETVYNDVKELVADLKANPWKLLKKEKKIFGLL